MNRIRIVLPLLNVVVAIALTASNYLAPGTPANPAFIHPDRQLCDAPNAPVAVFRLLIINLEKWLPENWQYPVDFVLNTLLSIGFVALVWYAVAIEIGGNGRSLIMPKTGVHLAADIVAVLLGFSILAPLLLVSRHLNPNFFALIIDALYVNWATAIVIFYGRDLLASIRQMRSPREPGQAGDGQTRLT
jgi:hypothetical protein